MSSKHFALVFIPLFCASTMQASRITAITDNTELHRKFNGAVAYNDYTNTYAITLSTAWRHLNVLFAVQDAKPLQLIMERSDYS